LLKKKKKKERKRRRRRRKKEHGITHFGAPKSRQKGLPPSQTIL
jgi:hypothetical protein